MTWLREHKTTILWYALVMLVLCAPALLNIQRTHNWGDDFAQYILQARNIAEGRSQLTTGYVEIVGSTILSTPALVPVGFPLLLAPVYTWFGNSILHFSLLISVLFAVLSLLTFVYYKRVFRAPLLALLGAALIAYNPWLLVFKASILTDIPYTLLGFLILLLVQYRLRRTSWWWVMATGLLLGLTLSIRLASLPLVVAIGLFGLYTLFKVKAKERWLLVARYGVVVLLGLAMVYVLNFVIFDLTVQALDIQAYFFHKQVYTESLAPVHGALESLWISLRDSLAKLGELSGSFYTLLFGKENEGWWSVLTALLGLGVVAGLYRQLRREVRVFDVFCLVYVLMLIYVHSSKGQVRYLLPVLPFLLEYLIASLLRAVRFIEDKVDSFTKRVAS